jgi:hypothetical protein
VTDRTILDTPAGPLKLLHTIELEPTTTGTTIHMRFAPPKSKREQAIAQGIGDGYGHALESSVPTLIAQLDEEMAKRDVDLGPEPDLAKPRPDGPLSGIQPLVIVG